MKNTALAVVMVQFRAEYPVRTVPTHIQFCRQEHAEPGAIARPGEADPRIRSDHSGERDGEDHGERENDAVGGGLRLERGLDGARQEPTEDRDDGRHGEPPDEQPIEA